MTRSIPRIVLLGPESTGKSWLARDLAEHYSVPLSEEFAREYVAANPGSLAYAHVDAIGRGQKANEDSAVERAARRGARFVVLDTDLVSTQVYSRHYFGECPEWIAQQAHDRMGHLYLLHHVDVPWVADAGQREQPERRQELFESFRDVLLGLGAEISEVLGTWDERKRQAIASIDSLLADGLRC